MEKKRLNFIEIAGITVIISVIVIGLLTFLPAQMHWPAESSAELEKIRLALPTAEARWQALGITDYDIDAEGFIHPGACADFSKKGEMSPLHLQIRQGQIIYVNEQQKAWADMCHFELFLPPKVFELMKKRLENSHPDTLYMTAEFDSTYGFLSSYRLLANQLAPNPNVSYQFTNFHLVDPKP